MKTLNIREMFQKIIKLGYYEYYLTDDLILEIQNELKAVCNNISPTYFDNLKKYHLKVENRDSNSYWFGYSNHEVMKCIRPFFYTPRRSTLPPYKDPQGNKLYYIDELDHDSKMNAFKNSVQYNSNIIKQRLNQFQEEHKKLKEQRKTNKNVIVNINGKAYKNSLKSLSYYETMDLDKFIKHSRSNLSVYSKDGKPYSFYDLTYI